ncbi:MAG: hypothetical protein HW377_1360 [Actinobacteria bacterium]|nr:hypothetical protein [Actinomycetota bacterium]MBM2827741.1 hypothetical protein [Actinomycetota bacterium]
MADGTGRSEFLGAATAIRRIRALLEGKRKEIDKDLGFFNQAEMALAVLGEADRERTQVEAKIAAAKSRLEEIAAKVTAAEAASLKTIAGFNDEVEREKRKTEGLKTQASDKQKSFAAAISALDAELAVAEKRARGQLEALIAQIVEKEAALSALRDTIASLAKL